MIVFIRIHILANLIISQLYFPITVRRLHQTIIFLHITVIIDFLKPFKIIVFPIQPYGRRCYRFRIDPFNLTAQSLKKFFPEQCDTFVKAMGTNHQPLIGILHLIPLSRKIICKKRTGKRVPAIFLPGIQFEGFIIILPAGMPEDPDAGILSHQPFPVRREDLHIDIPFPVPALLCKIRRLRQLS